MLFGGSSEVAVMETTLGWEKLRNSKYAQYNLLTTHI